MSTRWLSYITFGFGMMTRVRDDAYIAPSTLKLFHPDSFIGTLASEWWHEYARAIIYNLRLRHDDTSTRWRLHTTFDIGIISPWLFYRAFSFGMMTRVRDGSNIEPSITLWHWCLTQHLWGGFFVAIWTMKWPWPFLDAMLHSEQCLLLSCF